MSQATTVKEVLIATKWILNHLNWTQGDAYRDKLGTVMVLHPCSTPTEFLTEIKSCCLLGAVNLVETTSDVKLDTLKRLNSLLPAPHLNSIPTFNDSPYTTKQAIMQLLDNAIKETP